MKSYTFKEIEACNMCQSPKAMFKILGRRLNCSQGLSPKKKVGIATTIMQCKNCNLIFSNPQPIPANFQDHYNIEPSSYWPEAYFQLSDDDFKKEIENLKIIKGIKPGERYLDIGAGLGKSMIALEKQGMDVYGLEGSESFYKMAIEKMGIDSDRLKLSTLEEVEYEPDFFDFISFGAVLEHLYDPHLSIEKALKWLKPKGVIHIEVPNAKYLITRLISLANRVLGTDYVSNISPMHEPFHLYEFGIKTFQKHAELNNYKILDWKIDVCQTPLPSIAKAIVDPIMDKTNRGMQVTVWIQK
jgi:2-polyprenyl-3-methyl-5-hydroxy-6-metoxy-1,4-benzoquinol methylase